MYDKSHLVVLKADPQCISRDNDLRYTIHLHQTNAFYPARLLSRGATSKHVIKAAMARTVFHENRAILLPTVHSVSTSYNTDLLKGTDIGIEDILARPCGGFAVLRQ